MNKTALEHWICETEGLAALTRAELEALQLRRLNALLARERARGGFYAGLPDRLDRLSDLGALPFTTAEDLTARGGAMLLTSQGAAARVITQETSGTTGAAKRMFYTEGDCGNTVGFFAAGLSELVLPGDAVLVAMPFSGPMGLGELICAAVKKLGARPIPTGTDKTYAALFAILQSGKPQVYVGMSVPLLGLLRFCGRGSLRRALVSGDACPTGVTEACETLLGTRLFPHYGSREMGLGGAVTCPAHTGMHLRENHVVAEIIGPDGVPLPDGEEGELCVTTIGMEAQPLIRYRTGDYARILPGPCPCGGVTRRLSAIRRRPPEGDMAALDDALFRVPGLVDYRAARRDGALEMAALTAGPADAAALQSAAEAVFPGVRARVSVRPCRPEDRALCTGKRRIL